ncbi:MAG: hypothetical protein QXO84_00025 [Candidatus Aenigmatarchaeota archaeon]
MKGIAWIIPASLILILLSITIALFGFNTERLVERRALQEKVLLIGNRIELTGNLMRQAADLATLQAVNDAGKFVIAIDGDLEYNEDENLPYWSTKEEEYVKQAILRLAENYFYMYNKTFTDYFMNPQLSQERSQYWFLEWEKNIEFNSFDENEISINFGYFNVTYDDNQIRISKKYPIISRLKTKFSKSLDKSFYVIDMIKAGKNLNEIEILLSDDDISLTLEDKGSYVKVSIYENSVINVYDFSEKKQKYENLGLKFLVDKQGCYCITTDCIGFCSWGINIYPCPISSCEKQRNLGVYVDQLADVKKCGDFYILSNKEHSCDIFI